MKENANRETKEYWGRKASRNLLRTFNCPESTLQAAQDMISKRMTRCSKLPLPWREAWLRLALPAGLLSEVPCPWRSCTMKLSLITALLLR
jgi:hypothetical protein